ncbi:hypothetical protein [Paenibacillus dendrobii]|nr:hypothetical protein [Paenibacillus dendrobii]
MTRVHTDEEKIHLRGKTMETLDYLRMESIDLVPTDISIWMV